MSDSSWLRPLRLAVAAVLGTALRLLLLVAGALFGLLALAFGLVLAAGLVIWALLRGRRPMVGQAFVWRGPRRPGAAARPTPGAMDDVVDVDVREIRDARQATAEDVQPLRRDGER
ncbi:hypothetical protein [Pseudorhodoferax sp.]|uniref:hypothetical protein n=1 Tax=Pseudorhodoferax sp. TaxID=1993553 RepID=UPI002DD618D9|nr:hypothetical protein [Pseudorhodoferax sp.]